MVVKSKYVSVLLQSVITGHRAWWLRERTGEKVERILFDPQIGRACLFKEVKKVKGIRMEVPPMVLKNMGVASETEVPAKISSSSY